MRCGNVKQNKKYWVTTQRKFNFAAANANNALCVTDFVGFS